VQNNEITPTPTIPNDDGAGLQAEKARGSFDIRGKRKEARPVKIYAMIGLIVVFVILIFLGGWAWVIAQMRTSSSDVDESKAKADATLSVPTTKDDSMAQRKAEMLKKIEEDKLREEAENAKKQQETAPAKSSPSKPASTSSPNASGNRGSAEVQEMTAEQRKLGGGVMLKANINEVSSYSGGVAGSTGASGSSRPIPPGNASAADDASESMGGLGGGGSSSRGSLSNLSGPGFASTRATLAPSGKYLLAHGTYARCALYPEIVTEQPGIIDCRLTDPLYSADGSTVIAEAGDKFTGVQQVQMVAGQQNVFTAWTELETSVGVRAQLDSLGAGPMGASGTKAWINNHYMQRYGGAVALSFIQDALKAASNASQPSSGAGGYTINNSEQNVSSMADKALESTINIPPTGYILPGTVITVIIARDIDFSSVFENR
jgi:type IV secretion system protein VirB10